MELTQLRQFKAIAEHNSISAASSELHISQPALSTMLRKLEKELGIMLFERNGNRIVLNEAGSLALQHTKKIIDAADEMADALQEYALRQTHIRIGFCDPGPMWYCVPQLSVFSDHLIYEQYTDHDDVSLLLSGKYDILISAGELVHQDIESIPFIDEQILLSVAPSHPLAKESEISLKDERIGEMLLFVVEGAFKKQQQSLWDEVGRQTPLHFTEDYFSFCQMLQNPKVVTTTTKIVKHYRNDGPGRVLIPVTDEELKIPYYISCLKHSRPKLKQYLQTLRQCADEVSR